MSANTSIEQGYVERVRMWLREHVLAYYPSDDPYRRQLWIRRPDTGWWVFFLDERGHNVLSLKGRWRWLP